MKVTLRFYRKQYGFLAILTIVCSAIFAWGWFVGKPTDGMSFARSGAVATAILMAFLVSNYTERLEQIRGEAKAAIDGAGTWTSATAAIRKTADDNIKKVLDRTRAVIRYWYASLMFIATMIWGLGDYYFSLVHSAASPTAREIALRLIYLGVQ